MIEFRAPAMRTIAFFTKHLPSKIADELNEAGYRVLEALEIAELMYLFEHERAELVIIAPDVDEAETMAVQQRWCTITLKPEATSQDVLWELSNMFHESRARVQ